LAYPKHLLPTTVVGSYPQPDWLVDREMLSKSVPRTRMVQIWRIPDDHLEQAQDDATIVAIRDMERAGIDIVTDGEIRRESYSNRFATALDGIDAENSAVIISRAGQEVFRDADYIPMRPDVPAKSPELKPESGGYQALMLSPEEIDANAQHWAKVYDDIFR